MSVGADGVLFLNEWYHYDTVVAEVFFLQIDYMSASSKYCVIFRKLFFSFA